MLHVIILVAELIIEEEGLATLLEDFYIDGITAEVHIELNRLFKLGERQHSPTSRDKRADCRLNLSPLHLQNARHFVSIPELFRGNLKSVLMHH